MRQLSPPSTSGEALIPPCLSPPSLPSADSIILHPVILFARPLELDSGARLSSSFSLSFFHTTTIVRSTRLYNSPPPSFAFLFVHVAPHRPPAVAIQRRRVQRACLLCIQHPRCRPYLWSSPASSLLYSGFSAFWLLCFRHQPWFPRRRRVRPSLSGFVAPEQQVPFQNDHRAQGVPSSPHSRLSFRAAITCPLSFKIPLSFPFSLRAPSPALHIPHPFLVLLVLLRSRLFSS